MDLSLKLKFKRKSYTKEKDLMTIKLVSDRQYFNEMSGFDMVGFSSTWFCPLENSSVNMEASDYMIILLFRDQKA